MRKGNWSPCQQGQSLSCNIEYEIKFPIVKVILDGARVSSYCKLSEDLEY